jgi:hypothetical protein
MRRYNIILGLALGLIAPLVLAAAVAARPYVPPGEATVAADPGRCPSGSTSAASVPGGVYRAMVAELRQQGASSAEIQAELGEALVLPASGTRSSGAQVCITRP